LESFYIYFLQIQSEKKCIWVQPDVLRLSGYKIYTQAK